MSKASFVYVNYIRTTPEKLWEALTDPEFNREYWMGATLETDWKKGSSWKLVFSDGRVADAGEILEIEPQKRIVLRWRNEFMPEFKADGYTRCTLEMERVDEMMKLTVLHEAEAEGPHKLIEEGVSRGWPRILSSLKTLLETGAALPGRKTAPGS
ncbi:SRPBCC family protein [Mesorhizobium sp. BAC0120]|uniref:SRPBCC family protein n=1 Tax=Mesorhizobium sp. BAC0120 TaxID=3090670 RepID=UPI00298CFDC2|nr:SRPBCC family protein [Mesorhizobium sp. BAC0120]MDW6024154.1 SRPBCC family protein [Mesorhizobium sp. BAC0120]